MNRKEVLEAVIKHAISKNRGTPDFFTNRRALKKAVLLVVHFKNQSETILQSFFEILRLNIGNGFLEPTAIAIHRSEEIGGKIDSSYYAVILLPPKSIGRTQTIDWCVASWDECGAGEFAEFFTIKSKDHLLTELEKGLDDLAWPDYALKLAPVSGR